MTVTTRKNCSLCKKRLSNSDLYKPAGCVNNCSYKLCERCSEDIWDEFVENQCETYEPRHFEEYDGWSPDEGPWYFPCPKCGGEAWVHEKSDAMKPLSK